MACSESRSARAEEVRERLAALPMLGNVRVGTEEGQPQIDELFTHLHRGWGGGVRLVMGRDFVLAVDAGHPEARVAAHADPVGQYVRLLLQVVQDRGYVPRGRFYLFKENRAANGVRFGNLDRPFTSSPRFVGHPDKSLCG